MIPHRCGTCRFSQVVNYGHTNEGGPFPGGDVIECRRFPPVRLSESSAGFPRIWRSDWCGEWQVAEDEIEQRRR